MKNQKAELSDLSYFDSPDTRVWKDGDVYRVLHKTIGASFQISSEEAHRYVSSLLHKGQPANDQGVEHEGSN